MDSDGNIVLNFINIPDSYQVQVELIRKGTVLNDTIYGEEL
jgi:hypothetical protein